MLHLICRFCRDESGSVLVGDWAFVASILVLGAVAGMIVLHQASADESDDGARATAGQPVVGR